MNQTDKIFYTVALVLMGGFILLAILQGTGTLLLTDLGFPCSFRLLSGYYCPGCGGTHAVCALAAGDLLTCAKEHAFVLYTAAGLSVFLLWNTFSTLYNRALQKTARPVVRLLPVMHFYTAYIYIGISIILIQWIIKNLILIYQ